MEKKSIILLVVILVIIVIAIGGFNAFRQYQARRLAENYMRALQTGNFEEVAKILEKQGSGVPGMFPGVTEDIDTGDEEEESPLSIYNKLSAIPASDPFIQEVDNAVKGVLQEVFGGAKLVGYSVNSFGSSMSSISYSVKRATEGADVSKLINSFTNRDYLVVASRIDAEDKTGHLIVKNNEIAMNISFETDKLGQEITILAVPAESEEVEMLQLF